MNHDPEMEPDWDALINFDLSPASIIHAVFNTATAVHTGWQSCIEQELVVWEQATVDENSDNHCRFVEQEYTDEETPDLIWHDWTVELKIGEIHITGHWRAHTNSAADWDWSAAEAEKAFACACVLLGKRVRRGLVVEESASSVQHVSTRH